MKTTYPQMAVALRNSSTTCPIEVYDTMRKQWGYLKDGNDFPTIEEFRNGGSVHQSIYLAIAYQAENIGMVSAGFITRENILILNTIATDIQKKVKAALKTSTQAASLVDKLNSLQKRELGF